MENKVKKLAAVAAGLGLVYVFMRHRRSILLKLRRTWHLRSTLPYMHVEVINSERESAPVLRELKEHCKAFKVLGFDCEWVTVAGRRHPIALLQLSSDKGLCALFRLCNMKQIPKDLRELLEDETIIKVGVGPYEDAQKLSYDYRIGVASILDLRFMAILAGHKQEGLAKLARTHLDVVLDKSWKLACSNWEAKVLNTAQINYAASDALVAVTIFKKLYNEIVERDTETGIPFESKEIIPNIEPFLDLNFSSSFISRYSANNETVNANPKTKTYKQKKIKRNPAKTLSKAFYDNCVLEAPDGEVLSTIDSRKANWYLEQNLATKISDNPLTVRLNFEPAGRCVGDERRYYQTPKENQCVVCGRRDAQIRKNIVPREYRKHYPFSMKVHISHDVLLMCPECHQISNMSDLKIRIKLAEMCNAPFSSKEQPKYLTLAHLKNVKSAGKCLLNQNDKLPIEKVKEKQQILLDFFKNEITDGLTEELIRRAANLDCNVENPNYCDHGEQVVHSYENNFGGLRKLEQLWREHFLHTMKPKFLPEYWNVSHNSNRWETPAAVETEDSINKEQPVKSE